MLTPASAMARKNLAATPGLERMPAPINDNLPMWSSYNRLVKPMLACTLASAAIAVAPSVLGSVNEMSVRPVASVETFCTIMSMFVSAAAMVAKMRAASPGSSDTPTIVIFASPRSWATPVIRACSTGRSSIEPNTIVPGLVVYDERT